MNKDTASVFTISQIADWLIYERVRMDGSFNMYDPRARSITGLSEAQYLFVMDNFSELKAAASTVTGPI